MTTWLIVGAAGQLGAELMLRLRAGDEHVVGVTRPDLDLTDGGAVLKLVDRVRPDVIVNCAAYTAVDAAEADAEAAMAVNGEGPRKLASATLRCRARLIQISTDYVFSGDARTPYAEDAPTDPRSVYGATKLVGERAVLDTLPDTGFVVRTAWLYGNHGPNFVRTMLRLAAERETIDVVDDQVGQPTWTVDLADRIVALARSRAPAGIYHGTNSGQVSWFAFTRELFRLSGLDPERVQPTTTDRFRRPAPRPAYSVLAHGRWAAAGLAPMRPWDEALSAFLEAV